jgi:hypothetical protein
VRYHRALLGVGAVALAVTLSSCGGGSGPTALATLSPSKAIAFVAESTTATLKKSTAQVAVHGYVVVKGTKIPMSGAGRVDLQNGNAFLTMTTHRSGKDLEIRELSVAGNQYVGLTINGVDVASLTGKEWIEESTGGTQLNWSPVSMLTVLRSQGARVTELPSAEVGGVPCRVFRAVMTHAEVRNNVLRAVRREHLGAAEERKLLAVGARVKPPTQVVSYDASGLLRQIVVDLSTGVAAGSVTIDLSHFGASIASISTPASSEVMSAAAFQKWAASQG